jgi:hypothetical protein
MKRTFKRRLHARLRMARVQYWHAEIDWMAALFLALWVNALWHLLGG